MAAKITATTTGQLARSLGELVLDTDGDRETGVSGVAYNSAKVEPGDIFCCVVGMTSDGHEFARAAIEQGAVALCTMRKLDLGVPEICVSDTRRALARLGAAMFDYPAEKLMLLGVTGTNGKTTTTYLMESILTASGRSPGLIGTIETHVGGEVRPGLRTTPESLDLQKLLAEMVRVGADSVVMEVTSHALVLQRTEGLVFHAAAFTNLSQDHLDFHQGMEEYFEAKRSLFTPERAQRGAVNVDDVYGRKLAENSPIPCLTFGLSREADVRAVDVELRPQGSSFRIVAPTGEIEIESGLVGGFNVYNCLAAASTALQASIELSAIEQGLRELKAVPGRFESIDSGQPFAVIVDYAHTPDSLDNVLRAARDVADKSSGRVVCVFGAGGDRDRAKRPLMGAVAARLADSVIVTSDNPRSEDPHAIVNQILEGVTAESADGPDDVLVDRTSAIEAGIGRARPGDVVVIAGKGHESGQEFADHTIPFDDRIVARQVLAALGWTGGSR
ncbi:MAG TPA: UDP-N-acetylmuramoyl-L-alanyl-D-glutamate--2,6-diaminopimelate ligase [Actinomycetota bacterium]|nr:UDP-N-acetylmuramoyl-L-alanyl-D-glutamate--2,6-diaminopimelate ligase [Actinomycetota bacterium]